MTSDPASNIIGPEGIERLCADLTVDPNDVIMLVISYHVKSPRMCEITQDGWTNGWSSLGCSDISAIKKKLPVLRKQLENAELFQDIYQFSFLFSREENQKSLPCDIAIALWKVLLPSKFPLLDDWCEFVQTTYGKAISKDTWNLLLEFCTTVKTDFSDYDPDGAWPVLIDEFVASKAQNKKIP